MIADECVVAGLDYDIDTTFEFEWRPTPRARRHWSALSLEGGESSVPWDDLLRAGTDEE